MAKIFKECLDKLALSKGEFTPKDYPLAGLEKVSPEVKEGLLSNAEKKFNQSHRRITDFYGYLFDELHEAGLAKSDGVEAASMCVVYHNALQVFPIFAALSFTDRFSILREACKRTHLGRECNLMGYAMYMYLTIVDVNLDEQIILEDDYLGKRNATDSPWRSTDGVPHRRLYLKAYQNFVKLADYDTGKVKNAHYPVWTSYKPTENFQGITRTLISFDLWELLADKSEIDNW